MWPSPPFQRSRFRCMAQRKVALSRCPLALFGHAEIARGERPSCTPLRSGSFGSYFEVDTARIPLYEEGPVADCV